MTYKPFSLDQNRSLIITAEQLIISKKRFSDYFDMLNKSDMIAFKKDFTIIEKRHIHQIRYNKQEGKIKIDYASPVNVSDQILVISENKSDLNDIEKLFEETLLFIKYEKPESSLKHLMINSVKIITSLLISAFLVFISSNNIDNEAIAGSGRKRGLSKLFLSILEFIGPYGTALICALIIGYFVYNTAKRYKNPAMDLVFTKK